MFFNPLIKTLLKSNKQMKFSQILKTNLIIFFKNLDNLIVPVSCKILLMINKLFEFFAWKKNIFD